MLRAAEALAFVLRPLYQYSKRTRRGERFGPRAGLEMLEPRNLLATWEVPFNPQNPGGSFPTIALAQEAAQAGDFIQVRSAIVENAAITKRITLSGINGASISGASDVKQPVITIEAVDAVIEDLVIENGQNGGIVVNNSSPTIRRNEIRSNVRETRGAGIDVVGGNSNPQIYGNQIHANRHYQGAGHSGGYGGGIAYRGGDDGVIANNEIYDCDAWASGEGIYVDGGSPEVRNNVVRDNVSDFGQAIVVAVPPGGQPVRIFQNVIVSNRFDYLGENSAGIVLASGAAEILNNTIASNLGSGIIVGPSAEGLVVNNVIAGNSRAGMHVDGVADCRYNDLWENALGNYSGPGANPGPGAISANPLLDVDFRPLESSPLIDAGDPDLIDGDESRSDMGMTGGIRDGHRRHHRAHPYDVDNDGAVSAIDALLIINRVNITSSGQLPPDSEPFAYWDSDDDGLLAAHDALIIINRINLEIPYEVNHVVAGQNTEHRLTFDGFHFATIIVDPLGAVILRTRGGMGRDAWGTSIYLPVFIGGEGSDAIGGQINEIVAMPNGIFCRAGGTISGLHGTSFGTWDWQGTFRFHLETFEVEVRDAGYAIALADTLSNSGGDLNLGRITSNRLVGVPLQESGETGSTGDMQRIDVTTDFNGWQWVPEIVGTDYRVNDPTRSLQVSLVGERNRVDTLAQRAPFQINVADKPTVELRYTSLSPDVTIVWGGFFDEEESENFAADNVASLALVLRNSTMQRQLTFDVRIQSLPFGG